MLATFRYLIFGYRLSLPFELPDFDKCLDHSQQEMTDVQVSISVAPKLTLSTQWVSNNLRFGIAANSFEFTHPVLGKLLARNGDEIILPPGSEKYPRLIRTLLSNTLMPVIALQRGHIPLHSSIVDIEGMITAFIGDSGAGKSTLAGQYLARGNRVLTEDIGVIELSEKNSIDVRPGIPYFRLWQDSMRHLEMDTEQHPRVWKNRSKHHIPLDQNRDLNIDTLQRIYLLEESPSAQISITKMNNFDSMQALFSAVPFNILQHSKQHYRDFFAKGAILTRQLDYFRLIRPKDFSRTDELLELLNQHVSQPIDTLENR